MSARPTRFFMLGVVNPNFYLFKPPDGSTEWEDDVGEPWLPPSDADRKNSTKIVGGQLAPPRDAVRRIRGKAPMIGGPSIDRATFASTLQMRMDHFNISLRQLQSSSGVHFSTLSRVANGKQCSAVAYMTLCAWMMLLPTKFYQAGSPPAQFGGGQSDGNGGSGAEGNR